MTPFQPVEIYNNFIVLCLTKIKTNGLQQKGTKSPYKVVPQINYYTNIYCIYIYIYIYDVIHVSITAQRLVRNVLFLKLRRKNTTMIADYLWLSLGYKNAAYAAEPPTKCGVLDDVDGQAHIHLQSGQGNKKHVRSRENSITCNMTINLLQQRCRSLKNLFKICSGNKCCVKNRLQTPCYTHRFFVQQYCVKKLCNITFKSW